MILGFKYFDPLRGILPTDFPEFAGDIVFRARALLIHRSEKEIFTGLQIVSWMIDKSPARDEAAFAELARRAAEDSHGMKETLERYIANAPIRLDIDSATFALKACQAKFDITGDEKSPGASWAELFAILALGLIDQACKDEPEPIYGNGDFHESAVGSNLSYEFRTESRIAYSLVDAMDAVATAEGIHRFESDATDAKQKIKIRNSSAAIQRHAQTNEALVALKDFYISGEHKSMRNAARLFCDEFLDKVKHLAEGNRVRTLSEGLSKLLKNKRRSLQK